MNAHADMLIVVGYNGLNTPWAFIALLFCGLKFARFRKAKTSANKRFLLCL